MKNLLLLLAFAYTSPLLSQENTESPRADEPSQKFSLEILGGLNLNNMPRHPDLATEVGSFNSQIKPEPAFFAGLSGHQPIAKRLAVKMDVQFAVRGFGLQKNAKTFTSFDRYQASYLDFVPQLEYKVYKKIYFSLGGYAGLLLEERIKLGNQNWSGIEPIFGTLAEKQDWGLSSGLRVEFGRVAALVKYQHGLSPAIKLEVTDDRGASFNHHQMHRSLQVGLGFKVI